MIRRLTLSLMVLTASLAAQAGKKIDFAKQIFPIFERNCIECHRATYVDKNGRRQRPKGRVMLDTLANIQKTKRGKLIVAKKPDDSIIMESIVLAADDEDRMPPPKKGPPLSKFQVNLIKSWIEQGADYGKWTGEDAPKKPAQKTSTGSKSKSTSGTKAASPKKRGVSPVVTLSKGLAPAKPALLAPFAADDARFSVQSIGDGNPLLRVSSCGHTDNVDDRALEQLLPIADYIYELDLARSEVGDAGCAVIAKMPRLTKLDLRQSRVANAGAKLLAGCKELRTLNLFDTRVGDYSMIAFAGLRHLEQLYLWKTDVSAKAVMRLRDQNKALRVVFAPDMPDALENAPEKRRRR
ncbi:MAG: c-type cytochrome domain-containing protein [Planctomycetota bacterium]|nr:c-type cytochrome domain-containing protein [Planctomycetota bacterium]